MARVVIPTQVLNVPSPYLPCMGSLPAVHGQAGQLPGGLLEQGSGRPDLGLDRTWIQAWTWAWACFCLP